jgi:hypothetical protein
MVKELEKRCEKSKSLDVNQVYEDKEKLLEKE